MCNWTEQMSNVLWVLLEPRILAKEEEILKHGTGEGKKSTWIGVRCLSQCTLKMPKMCVHMHVCACMCMHVCQ